MYELLIIPKKYTEFSMQEMQQFVQKYTSGCTVEHKPSSITLKKENNFLTITHVKSDIVLQDA